MAIEGEGKASYHSVMRIVDAHAHIASWPTPKETEDTLLESLEKYGISYTIISNADAAEFPSVGDHHPYLNTLEAAKEAVRFAREHPDKIGVAIWLRPYYEKEITPELRAFIAENRDLIKALKFHPYDEKMPVDDPSLIPYLELAKELDLPVLVHTATDEESRIEHLIEVAKAYPEVAFVAAHLELCSNNLHAIEAITPYPNIYCDTAWVPIDKAILAMDILGSDRVMFGTDNPIDGVDTLGNPMYTDYLENRLNLRGDLYEKLMEGNAAFVYKI